MKGLAKPYVLHKNSLLHKSSLQLFSTTDDYFRSVLNEDKLKTPNLTVKDTLNEVREYKQFHDQRRELIRRKNRHVERYGIKDYEISDYEIDGANTSNYTRSKYHTDPLSVIEHSTQAVIFGLPYDATEAEIDDIFSIYGLVDKIRIYDDVQGDVSHAIVTYKTNAALQRCKEQAKNIWIKN